MAELRRRRVDAERSVAAILEGAVEALRRRPDASVEDMAAAAGVSRQTVYAHYSSRDAVVAAVVHRATSEVVAELDRLDREQRRNAADALVELLAVSWRVFERYPFLVEASAATPGEDEERHFPVAERLTALLRRGRRTGEFDRSLPVPWVVAAIVALGHSAGTEVSSGRMSADQATTALRISVLRLVGVDDSRIQPDR